MGQAFVEDPWDGSSTLYEVWTLRRLECQRQLGGLGGGPTSEALALLTEFFCCVCLFGTPRLSPLTVREGMVAPAGAGCVFSFSLLVWLAWASSQHGSLSVEGLLAWLASPWTVDAQAVAVRLLVTQKPYDVLISCHIYLPSKSLRPEIQREGYLDLPFNERSSEECEATFELPHSDQWGIS